MAIGPAWHQQDFADDDEGQVSAMPLRARLASGLHQGIAAQQQRLALWTPVALGTGIAIYFGLPVEPGWQVFMLMGGMAASLLYAAWRTAKPGVWLLAGLVVGGLFLAKAQTYYLATPQLAASSGPVTLSGWVERIVTASKNNPRVIIRVDKIEGLKRSAWPARVQATIFKTTRSPSAGEYVALSARLFALPQPVIPGGYDHGRTLWFQGIGATGRGTLVKSASHHMAGRQSIAISWRRTVDDVRMSIARRITATMPEYTAGMGLALITGDRSLLPKGQREQMSIAGLAHVLAISGLHMSLVAGGTFWLVRAFLALWPAMALNWPIKKWSAVAAILMGAGYLSISGGSISTQRAYIMLVIMFAAVVADRPAISLRNLAIAALLILVWSPQAVATASFQMSFMAVMALIAAYEFIAQWRLAHPRTSFQATHRSHLARLAFNAVAALAFTTIVASLFSGLPAAYHFNRAAPLSLISNLLALPVVSFVVMPSAVVATLAMPLGLEALPLWIMDKGLQFVLAVARYVAGMNQANIPVGRLAGAGVLLAAYGAIWLCLVTGRLRLYGVAAIAVGLAASPPVRRPDMLVENSAKNVAIRNADGALVPANSRRGRYALERWLRQDGDVASPSDAARRPGWTCEDQICTAQLNDRKIVYVMQETGLKEDCSNADILIAQFPLRGKCRQVATRIDRFDVWRNGAYAIYLHDETPLIETVRQGRGERPWVIRPLARKEIRTDGGITSPALDPQATVAKQPTDGS